MIKIPNKYFIVSSIFWKLLLFILIIFTLNISLFPTTVFSYDRQAAVTYADKWWTRDAAGYYNRMYYDYSMPERNPLGSEAGDCANFASQCLIAGGVTLNSVGYIDDKGCIPGAETLRQSLKTNHYTLESAFLPEALTIGDIVFLVNGEAWHTLFVVDRIGNDIYINCHTDDRKHAPLTEFVGESMVYLCLDSTPPETTIEEGPGEYVSTPDVSFSWSGVDDRTPTSALVYSYKLDNGDWSEYTKETTRSFSDLGEGEHTFYVKAMDIMANEDLTPAERSFTVGPPFILTVNPPFAEVSKGETVTHTVTVKNNYVPESETFSLSAYGFAPGWSVSGLSESFSLEPGSEASYSFLVANSGGYGDVDIDVDLFAMAETRSQEVYDWSAEPYNPYEHPDETYEISSSNYPTPWKIDTQSKIGILLSGWGNGLGHLLGRWNVETVGVKADLTIVGEPERDLSDLDVLLIGTGGLTGLENSYTFRSKLAGFVSQGGIIISLTSQYGYELNALPGSPSGYGWSEDQSCHTNAVYIDAYHPMFAGQDSANLDASVDGYLTQWPNDATILLRRTKNQMPAMVKYEYGQGKVVVLTFFTDWNYGHSGWTENEINEISLA